MSKRRCKKETSYGMGSVHALDVYHQHLISVRKSILLDFFSVCAKLQTANYSCTAVVDLLAHPDS